MWAVISRGVGGVGHHLGSDEIFHLARLVCTCRMARDVTQGRVLLQVPNPCYIPLSLYTLTGLSHSCRVHQTIKHERGDSGLVGRTILFRARESPSSHWVAGVVTGVKSVQHAIGCGTTAAARVQIERAKGGSVTTRSARASHARISTTTTTSHQVAVYWPREGSCNQLQQLMESYFFVTARTVFNEEIHCVHVVS